MRTYHTELHGPVTYSVIMITMCRHILVRAYAKQLKPLCVEAVPRLCNGCLTEHLSQNQHNVCLLDEFDKLMYCWDDGYNCLDEYNVSESIKRYMDIMKVCSIHRYTFFNLK